MLGLKNIELPLEQVVRALRTAQTTYAEKFFVHLFEGLVTNKEGTVTTVGLSIAFYRALYGLTRPEQDRATLVFPVLVEAIRNSGSGGAEFAADMQKFTSQFQSTIKTMR